MPATLYIPMKHKTPDRMRYGATLAYADLETMVMREEGVGDGVAVYALVEQRKLVLNLK